MKTKRIAWTAALMALSLFLPGCFDYEVDLKLGPEGQGLVTTRVIVPAGQGFKTMPDKLKTLLKPKPQVSSVKKGSRRIISETAGFRSLGRLQMRKLRFKVELLDAGVIYVGTASYRFTAVLMPTGKDQRDRGVSLGHELQGKQPQKSSSDRVDLKVARLYAASLKGRHFLLRVQVPGKIFKARPWVVGSHTIKPKVAADKKSVTWQLPLSVLVSQKVHYNLRFSADFKGKFVAGAGHAAAQSTMPGGTPAAKPDDKKGPSMPGLPSSRGPGIIGVTPRGKY